jgi:hypothetical protein
MTVEKLIRALSAFDKRLRVVTPGFDESNLEDVERVTQVRVRFHDEKSPSHSGRHVEDPKGNPAVLINFG